MVFLSRKKRFFDFEEIKKKMALSNVQQHLFSYLNLKKVASLKSTLKILEEAYNTLGLDISPVSDRLTDEIMQINKIIQKYNFEIVELTDEITCNELFILINTGDNITQKSLFYNENTTNFFSKIVNECVLSEEGFVSETQCLNLNSQTGITKSEAQCILENLIKDKWLDSTNDRISLGMRSIAELESSIKQHYGNNIKNCHFCKLIVLQGYICHNCKIKSHHACWKKYYNLSKKNCVCPSCKELCSDVSSHMTTVDSNEENDSINNPRKRKKNLSIF